MLDKFALGVKVILRPLDGSMGGGGVSGGRAV